MSSVNKDIFTSSVWYPVPRSFHTSVALNLISVPLAQQDCSVCFGLNILALKSEKDFQAESWRDNRAHFVVSLLIRITDLHCLIFNILKHLFIKFCPDENLAWYHYSTVARSWSLTIALKKNLESCVSPFTIASLLTDHMCCSVENYNSPELVSVYLINSQTDGLPLAKTLKIIHSILH